VADALVSIEGRYSYVFAYDPTSPADPWDAHHVMAPDWANDLQVMEPGRGYWVYATADATAIITEPPPDVDITLPQVTVAATPTIVNVGETVSLTVQATDDVGVVDVHASVNGVTLTLDAGNQATFVPSTAGLYTVRAQAEDAAGNIGRDTTWFRARTTTDNGPPIAELLSPPDDSIIESKVALVGTATDADLIFYALQAAPKGSDEYYTLFQGYTNVVTDTLGELHPGALPAGIYQVRVCAEDTWGKRTCSDPLQYDLNLGVPQPGTMQIAFQDGFIDVVGLPIAVHRIYDSRVKTQGDFGIGWKMALDEVKFEVNRVMGEDWEVQTVGDVILTYYLGPTADHRVAIKLPDGTAYRFRLRIEPQSRDLYPIELLDGGYFDPLPGTHATLTPNTQPFMLDATSGPVTVLDSSSNVYDPSSYTLSLPDGREFEFERATVSSPFKLTRIQDPNGNVLTITLTVNDDSGHTNTLSMPYTVLHTPAADFTWSPDAPDEGEWVEFQDATTDADGSAVGW
jgi:hypothetical protein